MIQTEKPEHDFLDLVSLRESLIGRTLIVRDGGQSYKGPISDIRLTSSEKLIIVTEWRATGRTNDGTETWRLTEKWEHRYVVNLDESVIRRDPDRTIHIIVRHGWVGDILPAGTEPLEKPTS